MLPSNAGDKEGNRVQGSVKRASETVARGNVKTKRAQGRAAFTAAEQGSQQNEAGENAFGCKEVPPVFL